MPVPGGGGSASWRTPSRPPPGAALAGAIVSAPALASLQVAGGPGWLDAGLAPSYFCDQRGALLALGLLFALGAGLLRRVPGTTIPGPWPAPALRSWSWRSAATR
ncbi:MAG: hypothetical protein U0133_01455 [Gemmatimonadales bacterium]